MVSVSLPIRTLAFWLVFMGTGLLSQIILLMSFVFIKGAENRSRAAQRARLRWSAINLHWFFGAPPFDALCSASASLPEQFILVSNHRSNLDPLFVFVIGRPLVFLSKKVVLKIPVIGWWMKLCNDVAVNRSEKASREQSLDAMRSHLTRGSSLLIFPEGTRQSDPSTRLGKFKDGAFTLASQTGVPIVPLVLQDTDSVWMKGSLMLNFSSLKFQILPPIRTLGRSSEDVKNETVEKMMEIIHSFQH